MQAAFLLQDIPLLAAAVHVKMAIGMFLRASTFVLPQRDWLHH